MVLLWRGEDSCFCSSAPSLLLWVISTLWGPWNSFPRPIPFPLGAAITLQIHPSWQARGQERKPESYLLNFTGLPRVCPRLSAGWHASRLVQHGSRAGTGTKRNPRRSLAQHRESRAERRADSLWRLGARASLSPPGPACATGFWEGPRQWLGLLI